MSQLYIGHITKDEKEFEREGKNWVVTRKKGKEILLGEMFSHSTNCVGLFEMIEEAKLSEEK